MSTARTRRLPLIAAAIASLTLAACGTDAETTDDEAAAAGSEQEAEPAVEPISVVATTSILGDIVEELLQDDGEVTVLMGPGVDPHGYAPSARDAATMQEADLVVANGLQLEEQLVSTLEAAEEAGVRIFELAPQLDPIEYQDDFGHSHGHDDEDGHGHDDEDGHGHDDEDAHGHDDEDGHGHDDDDHGHDDDDHGHDDDDHGHDDDGDHGHDHGPEDPHVWFDPVRMAEGVQLLAAELADVAEADDLEAWEARGAAYAEELLAIDDELTDAFAEVPDDRRVIVTNHDALGYLAARYDLEVVGTVIPGASTQVEADPQSFSALVATVEEEDIDVVFAENTDSTRLAEQLASEVVGRSDLEVEVVRIATDALGEPGTPEETYLGLLRATGTTVATELASSD
jgi:zinc/manganese transport system substrate-binding protein